MTVTILRMVTIQFHPFLPYMNLALTGEDFGSQISLNIVKEIVVVDELDKGHISRRPPSVEDNLR